METLQLKLSLAGIDMPEDKLRDLQIWLQDAGVFVKLEIEPPAEEEMGGKVTALILAFSLASESGHLPPSVEEALQHIEEWQQQQQVIRPVIHLPGKKKLDEEIQEAIRREQLHIEVREPDPPPATVKAQVVAPPKPPTGKK